MRCARMRARTASPRLLLQNHWCGWRRVCQDGTCSQQYETAVSSQSAHRMCMCVLAYRSGVHRHAMIPVHGPSVADGPTPCCTLHPAAPCCALLRPAAPCCALRPCEARPTCVDSPARTMRR